ncbi:MAG: PQQ-binding-like beta-propeller repeat protein, partial [Actinocrinis sp.]
MPAVVVPAPFPAVFAGPAPSLLPGPPAGLVRRAAVAGRRIADHSPAASAVGAAGAAALARDRAGFAGASA